MTRLPLLVLIVLLAGCTPVTTGGGSPAGTAAPAGTKAPQATGPSVAGTAEAGWTVPTQKVTVAHDPAVPPLPVLVEVRAGDHAGDGYERVTFAFRGPFPSYTVQLVPQVVRDGSGDPVVLPGATFLSIVFTPARSDAGTGPQTVGYRRLQGYEQVGDYEGYVSYGLGVAGAPVLIRTGESARADGTHVVALDVRV